MRQKIATNLGTSPLRPANVTAAYSTAPTAKKMN
jgi:hypothetical protein